MKHPLLLFLLAGLSVVSAEDLTTTDGKTYTGYAITKIEPDGLRITHASGTAKVPFEKLSDEIQKRYGYDPFNAYDHEQAEKVKAAALAKAEAARAAQKAKEAKQFKATKDFEQSMELAKNWGRMSRLSKHEESVRVADGKAHLGLAAPGNNPKSSGIVANVSEGKLGRVPVMKGKTKVGERDGWTYSKAKALAYIEASGISTQMEAGFTAIKTVNGELMLYPVGQARYIGLDGNKKTILRYTDNLEAAARFYHKHGTPPTCLDVVTDFAEQTKP